MSKQDARTFLDKWENDKAFSSSLQNAKTMEERKSILKKMNLHFSKEDYQEAYQEKYHKKLSDSELNKIIAAGKKNGRLSPSESVLTEIE